MLRPSADGQTLRYALRRSPRLARASAGLPPYLRKRPSVPAWHCRLAVPADSAGGEEAGERGGNFGGVAGSIAAIATTFACMFSLIIN